MFSQLSLVVWRKQTVHFIVLFMCSVLRAAWSHCPPVVCRKQVHSIPPLTPKFPFFIATRSTSSPRLSLFFSLSSFHTFILHVAQLVPWHLAYLHGVQITLFILGAKGKSRFFLCFQLISDLHAVACWICEMPPLCFWSRSECVVWSFSVLLPLV